MLQYEIKKLLKSHNKVRRTHSIYYEFLRYRRQFWWGNFKCSYEENFPFLTPKFRSDLQFCHHPKVVLALPTKIAGDLNLCVAVINTYSCPYINGFCVGNRWQLSIDTGGLSGHSEQGSDSKGDPCWNGIWIQPKAHLKSIRYLIVFLQFFQKKICFNILEALYIRCDTTSC